MELQTFDFVLLAIAGFLVIVGLFKGLSGWLGTLAGTGAAVAAAMVGLQFCRMAASSFVNPAIETPVAMVLDFLLALIVFGLVRKIVVRFVGFMVPQPLNALLGALGGLMIAVVVAGVLAATAVFEGCELDDGFVAQHSTLVELTAEILKAGLEGAAS